jgi:hypothetical protein
LNKKSTTSHAQKLAIAKDFLLVEHPRDGCRVADTLLFFDALACA